MTVLTTTAKAGPYAGSGTTGPFPVPFRFLEAGHLRVIRTSTAGVDTDLVLGTDYSVSGAGASSGSVTLAAALAVGQKLTVVRSVPATQEADYVSGDAFPAESHEQALDKLTMLVQQQGEEIGRSLRMPATVSGASTVLPTPAPNRVIGWNETATGLQNLEPGDFATIVAFGTAQADQFEGDGTTTEFELSYFPGALANLDVSVNGATYVPGVDYTWASGQAITFTVAPADGDEILVRYMRALPQGYTDAASVSSDDGAGGTLWTNVAGFIARLRSGAGAALVGFIQAGTGSVLRWVQDKLRERVSLEDFGAVGDGVADDTAAIQLALDRGITVNGIPGKIYRITDELTATVAGSILDLNGASLLADFDSGWAFSAGDGTTITQRVGIRTGTVYTNSVSTSLNGVRWRKNVRRNVAHENLYIKSFKGVGAKFEDLNWSVQGAVAPLIEGCGVNLWLDDNANAIALVGCHLYDADTYNLVLRGTFATAILGGANQNAGLAGIYIDNGLVGSLQASNQVTISGVYFEDNGVNHIVANNGRGLNANGNYINGQGMTGSAIKFTNWLGAEINGNNVNNMSAGTARDFVEADASSSMISVGKQHVSTLADAAVCTYGGSKLGIVEAFGAVTNTLPTATVTNRGSVVLFAPASGTGSTRSRPYMGMDTGAGSRAFVPLATRQRKMAAAAVTSPYTPNLASVETFDITVPTGGLAINAPIGPYEDGDRISFLLKQNGIGGHAVTWNAAYKTSYSNTGNTADRYATAEFVWSAGRSLWVQVAAMPWTS